MTKKTDKAVTILFDEEIDTFLESYVQNRRQTKAEIILRLVHDFYNREKDPRYEQSS
jgi:hypothetical protein